MKITPQEIARVPALEDCKPGLQPHEFNVLVAMQITQEKTASGLYLPDTHKDTEEAAAQMGRLVAASPVAWTYAQELVDSPDSAPQLGAIVLIGRYSGLLVTGEDGKQYRLLKDRDVAGVVKS